MEAWARWDELQRLAEGQLWVSRRERRDGGGILRANEQERGALALGTEEFQAETIAQGNALAGLHVDIHCSLSGA